MVGHQVALRQVEELSLEALYILIWTTNYTFLVDDELQT